MSSLGHGEQVGRVGAILRTYGLRGLARRGDYELRRRAGRLPVRPSGRQVTLRDDWQPDLGPLTRHWQQRPPADVAHAVERRDRVLGGTIDVFGRPLAGSWPPRWHDGGPLVDWVALSDREGDAKDLWEPSRLGFLLPVLRADAAEQALGSDSTGSRMLQFIVEDWSIRNPPFQGPNWMCAQEASLRALTVILGVGFAGGPTVLDGPGRARVEALLAASVDRVLPTLGYARSQRNNHAISEAGFLWVAAHLLQPGDPALAGRSARALRSAIDDQFAPDGTYSQHSFTYQRLALHVLLVVDLVQRTLGVDPPADLEPLFARSYDHLASIATDEGRFPNAGGNDGAALLQLTDCGIDDLRPLLSHLAARTGQGRSFAAGPWDEEAAWFGHGAPGSAPRSERSLRRGFHTVIDHGPVHAVLRAGHRTHRPAHADMLHLDVWVDGSPVVIDPGSYRYTAPDPWGNALSGEDVHNVPRVPGHPQAVRAGRFSWRTWSDAGLTEATSEDGAISVTAVLPLRSVQISRVVSSSDRGLVIDDFATSPGMIVRWNLAPGAVVDERGASGRGWRLEVDGGTLRSLVSDPSDPASGWCSPTYGELVPSPVIEVVADGPAVRTVIRIARSRDTEPSARPPVASHP